MSVARRSVTVAIEGIEVRCHCGVTEEERRDAQLLLVDLRVVPLRPADYAADDLGETVDYAALALLAQAVAGEREYKLIERLATVLAERVWAANALAELAVTVTKPAPPTEPRAAAARAQVVLRA